MKVNYPIPHKDNIVNTKTSDAKVVKAKHSLHSHGMLFENELNLSNEYYRNIGKALIYKKPTPVQIVKVDYPTRSKAKIVEGYYKTPSTTDYNGIYRGKYIDYEAKETNNLSFDFKHIFEHQVEHLRKVNEMGGIAFVIIYFKKVDEVVIMDITDFYKLWIEGAKGGRKSIKLETFRELGVLVERGYNPTLKYLDAVDYKYFENN